VIVTLLQPDSQRPGQLVLVGHKNFQVIEAQVEEIPRQYIL